MDQFADCKRESRVVNVIRHRISGTQSWCDDVHERRERNFLDIRTHNSKGFSNPPDTEYYD